MHRRQFIAAGLSAMAANMAHAQSSGFANWIAGFRARAAGISDRTFGAAFANFRYLSDSIERDRNQAEFTRPLADYIATAASDARVSNGREMVRRFAGVLTAIDQCYGVEPHVVTAVWGWKAIMVSDAVVCR